MLIAAIDIGATTIKAGLFVAESTGRAHLALRLLTRAEAATPGLHGAAAVLDCAAELIAQFASAQSPPSTIGVGSCGLVDSRGCVLETTDTMPGWDGTDIPAELSRRTGLPCAADNDGNVAALGEAIHGVGQGASSLAMFVLGTGVGGGVVLDGRIHHGAGSMAGTLGHLCVRPGGRVCACSASGCLEAYASAWAMRRYAGADARELFLRAQHGDHQAIAHVAEAGHALGAAMAHVAQVLNPDVIAVGGGIARGWPLLANHVQSRFDATTLGATRSSTRIAVTKLGPHAGLFGAAELARTSAAIP